MQFHHLEYFIQAVECKSLNRASRKLNVSPQALCAGIAALEKLITTFQQLGHTSSQIILSTPVDRHTPLEYEEELP